MAVPLLTAAAALLCALVVLRLPRGRRHGTASTDDVGLVLAAEIAQLTRTLGGLDVRLELPAAAWPAVCLLALGPAVAAVFLDAVGEVVAGLGVGVALLDTVLRDGAGPALLLVLTTAVLWLVIRLTRLLRSW